MNNENLELKCALYKALQTYNNSINHITKFTPFELFFGRKLDETLEVNIEKIEKKKNEIQTQAYINSENTKKKYIGKINRNREDPANLPEKVYAKVRNKNKLEQRNRKMTIHRQKELNVYDNNDVKHHKKNINKPRKKSFQVDSTINMQHRSTRPDNEPGTDDSSD